MNVSNGSKVVEIRESREDQPASTTTNDAGHLLGILRRRRMLVSRSLKATRKLATLALLSKS